MMGAPQEPGQDMPGWKVAIGGVLVAVVVFGLFWAGPLTLYVIWGVR